MFSLAPLSKKKNFLPRVALVLFVYLSCCTCVALVSFMSQSCCLNNLTALRGSCDCQNKLENVVLAKLLKLKIDLFSERKCLLLKK